jgi:hypothetical protein
MPNHTIGKSATPLGPLVLRFNVRRFRQRGAHNRIPRWWQWAGLRKRLSLWPGAGDL